MARRRSYDQMALDILTSNQPEVAKQAALTGLASTAKANIERRIACPDCGCTGPHDDNGYTGEQRTLCCSDCYNHFDA